MPHMGVPFGHSPGRILGVSLVYCEGVLLLPILFISRCRFLSKGLQVQSECGGLNFCVDLPIPVVPGC